jgi:hypothetical protein
MRCGVVEGAQRRKVAADGSKSFQPLVLSLSKDLFFKTLEG